MYTTCKTTCARIGVFTQQASSPGLLFVWKDIFCGAAPGQRKAKLNFDEPHQIVPMSCPVCATVTNNCSFIRSFVRSLLFRGVIIQRTLETLDTHTLDTDYFLCHQCL